MARIYTDEQHAWIAEHYADMTNAELADAYNERFDTDWMTPSKLNAYGSNHHLRKSPEAFCRRNRKYTDEQLAWMREFIPGHHEAEIIDAYEERFGERLTVSMVANLKVRLGVISGTDGGQFRRGNEPANKGRTWDEMGFSEELKERMRATAYRKGNVPMNAYHTLLDEKTDSYGTWVYVRPRNRRFPADDWVSKARFLWMQANGRDWPEHHKAVFADRNRDNLDPANIVPVPNELYAIVTAGAHGHALPWHDRETLEVAMTHARLIRERRKLEMAPRECGACGETFSPRFPAQATCDACLEAGRRSYRRRAS